MNLLLDECLPRRLKRDLPGYSVRTVPQMGWAGIENGDLLPRIEPVFETLLPLMPQVLAALRLIVPGQIVKIGP